MHRHGQFVTHIAALPGNPYDGHKLATVIPAMEDMIGDTIERLLADAGYRGHNAPTDYKFRVYTSGQKRRLTPQIKRELRRRAAIEPVIGHLKAEHRMGRNYLAHHAGDAVNAVLAAAGYNFHLLLRWLELVLSRFLAAQKAATRRQVALLTPDRLNGERNDAATLPLGSWWMHPVLPPTHGKEIRSAQPVLAASQ